MVHRVYHFGAPCVPFWCTVCTILVHRVYHFGAPCVPCVPFWCTVCTVCTILVYLVYLVYHFGVLGVLGVPFWCTILVYLVYLVYHFGVPFWCTWCTWCTILVYHFGVLGVPPRARHPFALPHNSPKTNPIPETPLQIITGLLRKAPQKPPPGLTARLSSPPTQTGLHRRRQRTTTVTAPAPARVTIRPAGQPSTQRFRMTIPPDRISNYG